MKVAVIGTGAVGCSAAYAMVVRGIPSEVVLIDPDQDLARAQAEDLMDATPFAHPVKVRAGDFSLLAGSRVIALCCGARQKPGESRLELLARNAAIFDGVMAQVVDQAPEALLVVVSNPVDVLTERVCALSPLPAGKIFGTGTMLDTARFRTRLGRILGVSPRSVHAYVLGEHGDSEVLVWSSASVGGIPLEAFLAQMGRPLTPHLRQEVDEAVRHGAARIIQGKGATYYGIGAAVAKIMKTIRDNEHALLTVSAPSPMLVGHPVPPCLSLPRVIGSDGIQAAFLPPLSPTEEEAIQKSARVLREAAQALEAR